ncbi:MAG: aldehyde dehydrogenase family protein [candidate division KSB1 bacterium]|nr:aldehyde dehydrogenase family protein [candidate division KSB1 bacterium]
MKADVRLQEVERQRRQVASMDPATGEIWATYEAASEQQVGEAIRRARHAQPAWQEMELNQRLAILRKMKQALYEQRQSIAELITRESGKPMPESYVTEIMTALDLMGYYLKRAPKLLRPRQWRHDNIALKLKKAISVPQPWGVVGVITPWNYPLMLPVGAMFPALVAGNAVILKPAEYTTTTAMKLGELAREVGVPEEVFQVLPGDGITGAALIENGVDRVVFIGSERAGRSVAKAAAERFIPVTLEMGGSDPMLVLRDAPVENAAAAAIWGRFLNAGQTCVAVKRVFVEEPIYEAFVHDVVQGVKKLRLGPGNEPNTDVGPMIREVQVKQLEEQLQDAVAKGATVRAGGRRRPDIGPLFFEPTVLTDVTSDMLVMQEETFGPILPIVPVKSAEDAVEMANATSYGLSASIWTRDRRKAFELAQRIQAGAVTINDNSFHPGACDVPYGGFKHSGLGKSHGDQGLLDMVREQYIDIDPLPSQYKPWWFRYSPSMREQMSQFIAFIHGTNVIDRLRAIPASLALLWHRNRLP